MNKFSNVIRTILWWIFIVIPTLIFEGLLGSIFFITIVGKPLAKHHFAYIKLILKPNNKEVASKYSRNTILNTTYGILGGFIFSGLYYALGSLLAITIIGYPLAKKLYQLAKYSCAPFGCEIVELPSYSKQKDTTHDIKLLINRISNNKDMELKIKGKKRNVYQYILDTIRIKMDEEKSFVKVYKKYTTIRTIASFIPLVILLIVFNMYRHVLVALIAVLASFFITIFIDNLFIGRLNKIFLNDFAFLFNEFNEPHENDSKTPSIAQSYLNIINDLTKK